MIINFKCKKTENLFNNNFVKEYDQFQRQARRKLLILDASIDINDLRVPPGNRLEKLSGDRKGKYSIRINQKWRICFLFKNSNAYEVEIIDYH